MDMESMESIEPLASLLSLYKEKEKVLRHYLPQKTLYKLKNAYFLRPGYRIRRTNAYILLPTGARRSRIT